VALNAPKPDEGPSGVRGNRDEAMTVRQREPVWELNPSALAWARARAPLALEVLFIARLGLGLAAVHSTTPRW